MKIHYKPEDVDCRLCTMYADGKDGRKRGCTVSHCICLAERMEVGAVGYQEALKETFSTLPALQNRLTLLSRNFSGSLWQDQAHKERMDFLRWYVGWVRKDTNAFLAVIYLLTANEELYHRTFRCFTRSGFFFDRAEMRGMLLEDYALFGAAKTIYLDTMDVVAQDLIDPQIISDDVFRLIVNACIIRQFGADALSIHTIK